VAATRIELRGMEGSRVTLRTPQGELGLELPLPGLYNVYNALGAVATAIELDVAPERIASALAGMRAAFGRVETIDIDGTPLSILLIKNPAGANEVLRTLRLEAGEEGLDLWIALNDRIADGRDVSWVWDADFELLAGAVRRVVCAGTRAPEMALRLKYAGWPAEAIEVEPEIGPSLDRALAGSRERLFALPTYTALLELRKLLAGRGLAREFWR
jgi:UDP-N-acetylmuramyl tripeptide synthase